MIKNQMKRYEMHNQIIFSKYHKFNQNNHSNLENDDLIFESNSFIYESQLLFVINKWKITIVMWTRLNNYGLLIFLSFIIIWKELSYCIDHWYNHYDFNGGKWFSGFLRIKNREIKVHN
jgi:hypothetical protein